jgi:hypothetical protein
MPLYQDEVALRASRARFLTDGATNYGLFAQCTSNTRTIALIFRPVAYLYSTFDSAFGWAGIRAFPVAIVLAALGIALMHTLSRRNLAASLLLLAGFIGVAGSGLVLSRMETPTLLFGIICMAGFSLVRRRGIRSVALAAYFVIAMFFALLALFIHPQAMVFVPILVLLAITNTTQCRRRWVNAVAWFSILCVVSGSLAAYRELSVQCPELPAFQTQLDRLRLPGLANEQGLIGLQTNLSEKLNRYANNFHFQRVYDVGYLPSIDPSSAWDIRFLKMLNASVSGAVWFNLLLACCLAIGAATSVIHGISSISGGSNKTLISLLTSPAIYVFVVLSGHLALLLYDTPTNFYRAFYIHLVLVITNAIVLSNIRGELRRTVYPIGACSLLLCALSTEVAHREIRPKLLAHWEGPSISLSTDWRKVSASVHELEKVCRIERTDAHVVVDDLTYDAMKTHVHLLLMRWILLGEDQHRKDRAESLRFFNQLSATSLLVDCRSLQDFDLDVQARVNGLCCLEF